MRKFFSCTRFSLALILPSFIGCSTSLGDYEGTAPQFVMEEFLSGQLVARGMVQDYTGKVTRRFCVDIDGQWQMQDGQLVGTIAELFHYSDGEKDERVWTVKKLTENGDVFYEGTAGDVVGKARGRSQGYAFYWEYDLELPIGTDDGEETIYQFAIKDWIYLLDQQHALNRSALKKFGVEVGQLTIFFDKKQQRCEIDSGSSVL